MINQTCPLCHNKNQETIIPFYKDKHRGYLQCLSCSLVYVPESFHLSEQEEKRIYDYHQNNAEDQGYQQFLSRLTNPLTEKIKQDSKGLDFGCGNASAIPFLLQNKTDKISLYDKFYANQSNLLKHRYDFISCTEVFEHLRKPREVLEQLINCLLPSGILAIMTKRVIDQNAFANWHYKNDLTHIIFFSEATFNWMAQKYQLKLEIIDKDVIFLYKN